MNVQVRGVALLVGQYLVLGSLLAGAFQLAQSSLFSGMLGVLPLFVALALGLAFLDRVDDLEE